MVTVTELEQLLLLSLLSGITLFWVDGTFVRAAAGWIGQGAWAGWGDTKCHREEPIGGMEMPALPAVQVNVSDAIKHQPVYLKLLPAQ